MGFNVTEEFPSKYLGSDDLKGQTAEVTIQDVTREAMNDGKYKLCLHFRGKRKGLLLNKTNATRIAEMYGEHTDGWLNQVITLVVAEVEYQGNTVPAVRVKPPAAAVQAARQMAGIATPPARKMPPPQTTLEDELDDEVPF